ncbi:MAG: hypothetical protein ABIJ56_17125 [Pseudomonadota bacterium]
MTSYERIVTHNDFDGVISAAIVSRALGIDRFFFTGPRSITESRFTITERDVVCDLPYPAAHCGLWFDHHEGSREDVRMRGMDPDAIPGSFAPVDSCARVVFDYFSDKVELPGFFAATVSEADMLDGFNFSSIEDWRRETPGKIVDGAINGIEGRPQERDNFLRGLVRLVRELPLEEVGGRDNILAAYRRYQGLENRMMQDIKKEARFLDHDPGKEIILIDFTGYSRPPHILKKLTFLLFTEAKAVIEMKNPVYSGRKSTDLSVSMSLGICLTKLEHKKDVGEIMRELDIGDGHTGAGAGMIHCGSKAEMLSARDRLIEQIFELWKAQV